MSITTLHLRESDIRLFLQPAPKREGWIPQAMFAICLGVLSAIATFTAINLPAYIQANERTGLEFVQTTPVASTSPVPLPNTGGAVIATPEPTPQPLPDIPDNTVSVPNLGISVPVSWNVPLEDKLVQQGLKNGVVHINGTARPGQQGTVFITGHSSDFPTSKGSYKTIFAPLHRSKLGDQILVRNEGVTYQYKVTRIYKVKPSEVSALTDGNGSVLRLVTCTPIGTSLKRLVVEAEQVSPDTSANQPFTAANFGSSLPTAR